MKSEALSSTVRNLPYCFFFFFAPSFSSASFGFLWPGMTHFADLYTPARARPSAHLAHINHHLRLPRSQLWCRVHHPAIKTIFPGQQSVLPLV